MKITLGIFTGNEVSEWFHQEDTLNGDYLAALHNAESDEDKAEIIENEQDFWESNPVLFIGKFIPLPDNTVELGVLEKDDDFSAELDTNMNHIIVHQSNWAIKCGECSPAFLGCGDCTIEGDVIAYCLPPSYIAEDLRKECVKRMFKIEDKEKSNDK